MKIELDIDLQQHAEDAEFSSIEDMIVNRAVEKVADRIARTLESDIDGIARERAIACIDAQIDDLQTATFQKTNHYGQPTGDAKTFLELVLESVDAWGSQSVGYDGRPTNSTMGSDKKTRIQWLAYKMADEIAQEHMKEMMEELKETASGKIGNIVRAGVEKVFGLQKKR